jgi:hypothetical protein
METTARRGTGGNTPAQQLSQKEIEDVKATASALAFRDNNPDYFPSKFNSVSIQQYIKNNGLDPFRSSSYQQSYDALTLAGELEVEPKATTATVKEEPKYEPVPTRQVLTDGRAVGFHRPDQLEDLRKLPLKELGKLVHAETASTRARLQRRGIRE